jgi:hypothetical protein
MSSHEGTDGGFELGKKDAQTWAAYMVYDMERTLQAQCGRLWRRFVFPSTTKASARRPPKSAASSQIDRCPTSRSRARFRTISFA